MLNALKSIINSKLTFLETADLILEEMDDSDIMDDIIDDELLKDLDSSDDTSDSSFSVEDENEAIFTFGLDTRTNSFNDFKILVSSGFDDITGDVNPMDGFLDESWRYDPGYSYEGVPITDFFFQEDVGDEIPPIDSGNNDQQNNTNQQQGSAPQEETEVTTAVKEELKEDAAENGETTEDTSAPSTPEPTTDSSETSENSGVGSGTSKMEMGRQIMKQLKKAEDITFDYFFSDES